VACGERDRGEDDDVHGQVGGGDCVAGIWSVGCHMCVVL